MKHYYLTKLILLCLLFGGATANLSGCALLSMNDLPDPDASAQNERQAREEARHIQEMQIQHALAHQDLILGMRMEDVRSAWGEPRDVETAGDSYGHNERWTYYNGLSSRWSVSTSKTVYFEQGRVVGWETH